VGLSVLENDFETLAIFGYQKPGSTIGLSHVKIQIVGTPPAAKAPVCAIFREKESRNVLSKTAAGEGLYAPDNWWHGL